MNSEITIFETLFQTNVTIDADSYLQKITDFTYSFTPNKKYHSFNMY